LTITRATEADVKALDALRRDAELAAIAARAEGVTNTDQNARHFAMLDAGDFAAVTRAGDVFRLGRLDFEEIEQRLADTQPRLPSVAEARAANEISRERAAAEWTEWKEDQAARATARAEARAAEGAILDVVMPVQHAKQELVAAAEDAVDRGFSIAGRAVEGFARSVIAFLSGWFDAPVRLTPDEVHRREQVAPQQAEARAVDEAAQQKEEARDWQMFEQGRQQQEQDFAARFGTPPSRSRERDDDDRERGYERER
jgi:hypothetical protein